MKGINLKRYYKLFYKLDNGDTEGIGRKEYKEKLFSMLSDDLEKNFLDGHITDIKQILSRDYTCNLIIEYNSVGSTNISKIHLTLMEDVFYINGLCIKY